MKNVALTLSIIVIASTIFLTSCKKPEGCTDASALNYDPEAKKDDGSCEFKKEAPTTTPDNGQNITISDNGSGTGTTTWTKNNVYLLDGFVFVNSGQTLTIEAGTVIKGKPGTGANASALVVARGAKIIAQGTTTEPIIFTFEQDMLDGAVSTSIKGQWGGVILLGNARLNSTPGETQIEGIPTSETRGLYGGSNDQDNSGIFQYVSIRHGGTDIGAGNEINGLTLGGIGSATTIDHIEVVSNADDGVEFFGGTPQLKHILVAYCGDDSYDYDEGFRGKGQFWLAIQGTDSDRGGEHDGGTNPEDGMPYAHPMVYNATYIGNGMSKAITFRDNAGGEYHNSIFHNFGKGFDIEDLASGEDSYNRLNNGELKFSNIIFSNVAAGDMITSSTGNSLEAHSNVVDLKKMSIAISSSNPVPTSNVIATPSNDNWYTPATYAGAFDASASNWAKGWTKTFK